LNISALQIGVKLQAQTCLASRRAEKNFEKVRGDPATMCGCEKKEATQRGNTASPVFPVTVLTTVTKNREQEVM
jgi:hypothetical protein